jgi:hypothetical protein
MMGQLSSPVPLSGQARRALVSDDLLGDVVIYRPTGGPHPCTAEGHLARRADGTWYYRARLLPMPGEETLPVLAPPEVAAALRRVDCLRLTLESLGGEGGPEEAAAVRELQTLSRTPDVAAWWRSLHQARRAWLRVRPATTSLPLTDWTLAVAPLAVLAERAHHGVRRGVSSAA